MKTTYFKSKEMVIAACALLRQGQHAKAGAALMKASQMPDFEDMVEDMNDQQQQAQQAAAEAAAAAKKGDPKEKQVSALASIVEGMADGVNDIGIDDLLEDLDYEPGDEPPEQEEVGVDAPGNPGSVNVDVDDDRPETASLSPARQRLMRAQANLQVLTKRGK